MTNFGRIAARARLWKAKPRCPVDVCALNNYISEVTLRRTRLLGWVTVIGQAHHFAATQANSASYPHRDEKCVPVKVRCMHCGWRIKAGHSTCR